MSRVLAALAALAVAFPAQSAAAPLVLDIGQAAGQSLQLQSSTQLLGDVNGDGVPDVAFPVRVSRGCDALQISFRRGPDFGAAGGFRIVDAHDGCPGFPANGAVSALGVDDVNGDGVGDLILQDYKYGRDYMTSSLLYVVFGKRDRSQVDLAHLGANGFAIKDSSKRSGAVGEVRWTPADEVTIDDGDVNGDGRSDILIQRIGEPTSTTQIVFGKADTSTVDLHHLGPAGLAVVAPSGSTIGRTHLASDMNGDKRSEILVEVAQRHASNTGTTSAWRVLFGRDASGQIVPGTDPNGFKVDATGGAAAVGDVNGDSRGDIAFDGAVVFGKADTTEVDPAHLGAQGFRITDPDGTACPDASGTLGAAGDVNGDGLDDILFGCTVVFGKSDTTTVDLEKPTPGAFAIWDGSSSVDGLRPLADLNGDGRADLLRIGSERAPALIPSPASVATRNPLHAGSGTTPTIDVLCLLHDGCNAELRLTNRDAISCGDQQLAAGLALGDASTQLGSGDLTAVQVPVSDATVAMARCRLGIVARQRVTTGVGTPGGVASTTVEIEPSPAPLGPTWLSRRISAPIGGPTADLLGMAPGAGGAFAVVDLADESLFAPTSGRVHPLHLRQAQAVGLTPQRLLAVGLVGGSKEPTVQIRFGSAGAFGQARSLDARPAFFASGAPTAASNGRGTALVVWSASPRRRRSRSNLVARFITGDRRGRATTLPRTDNVEGFSAAVDARGDGIIAWCSDTVLAIAFARRNAAFGRTHRVGDNSDGGCGDVEIATAGRQFVAALSSQYQPYDGPDGPVEITVARGRVGGPLRVKTLDTSNDGLGLGPPSAPVAFAGGEPIVGWSTYDPLAGTSRAVVADAISGARRWLSPPNESAELTGLTSRPGRGSVATWTRLNEDLDATGVFASFASKRLDFGAPETLDVPGAGHTIEGPPAVALARPAMTPTAMWLDRRGSSWRLLVGRRP